MSDTENKQAPSGLFDQKPNREGEVPDVTKKEEFKDPFVVNADAIAERSKNKLPSLEELTSGDSTLERTASAVNNGGPGKNVQADLDEMDKFSKEDLELAEQMIFRGFAEFDAVMPKFPKYKFTICSTSAEEIAIVEEIVFDTLKSAEDDSGNVNLPQSKITGLRNGLFMAISYRGMNREEIAEDTSCQLNVIKKAVIRVTELENSGKLEESEKLKKSLKKRLLQRATIINRMATPVIDFLSESKFEFDSKMLRILSSKEIVPKS